MVLEALRRRCHRGLTAYGGLCVLALVWAVPCVADESATIERVKPSIVAIGTFQPTRNPQFTFTGTGFAVGDGSLIATNDHVIPKTLDVEHKEAIAVAVREAHGIRVTAAQKIASDSSSDLAVLKVRVPLPPLKLGSSDAVREGQAYLFTGFPIGPVLGLQPVTHNAMISAITPMVIPAARASQLDGRALRALQASDFTVFQLDGTAYPGNSGSPVYNRVSGEVIGIVNSVFVKGTKEAALTHPSGITYAIPAERLKALLRTTQTTQ